MRNVGTATIFALCAVVFVADSARGFAEPAMLAFEAQGVRRKLYLKAST